MNAVFPVLQKSEESGFGNPSYRRVGIWKSVGIRKSLLQKSEEESGFGNNQQKSGFGNPYLEIPPTEV